MILRLNMTIANQVTSKVIEEIWIIKCYGDDHLEKGTNNEYQKLNS